MRIQSVRAREILDSRGNPTIEADVLLEDGTAGRAAVPSGASTGSHEARELRDGDKDRYWGKGVLRAAANVDEEIAKTIVGRNAFDQEEIDKVLINLDGTENKERLGANAILAVSLAVAKAAALKKNVPLFEYIHSLSHLPRDIVLPLPLCNIVNGGRHAVGSADIQEFMIVPVGAQSFREALRAVAEVFYALKVVLEDKGYGTTVGDEGGFAPQGIGGNEEVLMVISQAIEKTSYRLGEDIVFGLDVASSELFVNDRYILTCENKKFSSEEMISWYQELKGRHPIVSIEDGLAENDWEGWKRLTHTLGKSTQLVGDDLLVTNTKFLSRAIKEKVGNAILIKLNQIGTLTETIKAVDTAHKAEWSAIISHRSGETEDTTIAHLAVGLGTGQIKTGSVSRSDRTAKYNELLRIEEILGKKAEYASGAFK